MSQQMRRTLAAAGLSAALLLTLSAPSRAASLRAPRVDGWVDQVWSWLWSLLPGPPVRDRQQETRPAVRKTSASASPTPSSPPPASTDEQGSMIDPDGKP